MTTPAVKKVSAQPNYFLSVSVVFENGEIGLLDMKPFLDFGVFTRLKDPDAFQKVKVAFDTVEWESGPDLDPEFVYKHSTTSVVA